MAGRKLIGQLLKERGVVHEGMIQEALVIQKEEGGRIGEILIRLGYLGAEDLTAGLAEQAGMEFFAKDALVPEQEALSKVDGTSARVYGLLPLRVEDGSLVVALADPANVAVLDDLTFAAGAGVRAGLAEPEALQEAIEKAYGESAENLGKEAFGKAVQEFASSGSQQIDLEDKEAMAQAAPVVKLLNYILFQAVRDKASDIHLEPFENDFKIRYRVDGVLFELEAPPPHLAVALISRVKVMADLDIAETRIPQDGRIELSVGGRPVDLRVSTLPTMFGESCVMRVLDRSVVALSLENIGLREDEKPLFEEILSLPHGIVLVTGPTGSGKTTTLYAALNEVNREDVKVITVEDPVEYDLEGIVQVPIHNDIGVTYASVLRTILRQDPDKILVGEIRDEETARTAIEASLTGHTVFSTLHTNDAPSAVTRMLDMGVEPYLLTSTVEFIIAQRLVRRICKHCKTFYEPDDKVLYELAIKQSDIAGKKFAFGKGCDECNYTGYAGRKALFEIMRITDSIKALILEGSPTAAIREEARKNGMRNLREAGLLAIYDADTTVEEVLRETM
ncbi:MAG TPA: pilus assembly protein PilB [Planctomycetes bacterium]|nr:pilus assembly protein PilB [Planctomycetota bacterium]